MFEKKVCFGAVFKKYRSRAGLSRADVARKLCITRTMVGNYETYNASPSSDSLLLIMDALSVPSDERFEFGKVALHSSLTIKQQEIMGFLNGLSDEPAESDINRLLSTCEFGDKKEELCDVLSDLLDSFDDSADLLDLLKSIESLPKEFQADICATICDLCDTYTNSQLLDKLKQLISSV